MPCCGQVSAVRSVRDRASLTRRAARGSHRRLTTLFTIQARSAWDSVLETGVYRPDPARQDAEGGWARFGYAWIRREMQKRIAAPPTSGIVWAWKRPRPSSTLVHWYLPPGAEGVFLELRVLSTRVLSPTTMRGKSQCSAKSPSPSVSARARPSKGKSISRPARSPVCIGAGSACSISTTVPS